MGREIGSSTAATQPSPSPSTSTSTSSSSYYNRNCSPGICAPPYCLQSCAASNDYYFLSPPPPSDDSSRVSPLMIALISVLASAFLLLTYYTFASKLCKRRRSGRSQNDVVDEEQQLQARIDQLLLQDGSAPSSIQIAAAAAANSNGGLEEQFIKSITVFKYKRGDGLVESTDCAVCLTEFNEGESLRLMPNCQHAFHLPCIDTWLRTHSSCPICRTSMIGPPPPPPPPPARRQSAALSVALSRMRVQRGGDVVVVVVDGVGRGRVSVGGEDGSDERDLDRRRQLSPEATVAEDEVDVEVVGEKERGRSNH